MIGALAWLLGGALLLYLGAESLVRGSSRLGVRYGVSPVVVGMTLVSLGTSAPELVVSLVAAARGSPDLVVGNVLGSNLANVGLVLGLTALVRPLGVASTVVRREVPVTLAVTVLLLPLLLGGMVQRWEGLLLVGILVGFMAWLIRSVRDGDRRTDAPAERPSLPRNLGVAVGGAVLLVAGGHGTVEGALALAAVLGLPELLVGLSAVALGTSLPELATSLVAALRSEVDIAVGNVVGSNLFNLTVVLGGTAAVVPVAVAPGVVPSEYLATAVLTALLLPVVWTGRRVQRMEGGALVLAYGLAWVWMMW